MTYGSICPTLRGEVEGDVRRVYVVSPESLAGREVVPVDGHCCRLRITPVTVCGLVSGHTGPCWEYSEDALDLLGAPHAVVRPR